MISKRSKLLVFSLLGLSTSLLFQNCGEVRVSENLSSSLSSNAADIQFNEITILVDVNQPKVVNLNEQASISGTLSFNENSLVERLELEEGVAELSSSPVGVLTFTPAFGFRGQVPTNLFIRQSEMKIIVLKINFVVQNPLRDLKPSLAVRAAECLLCHAKVKGDVITDFGFKSAFDTTGRDYFFTPVNGADNHAYSPFHSAGDPRNAGWSTAIINGDVILPKVGLDAFFSRNFLISRNYVEAGVNKIAATLQEYISKVIFHTAGRVNAVREKTLIYIGAPTAAAIRAAGRLDAAHPMTFIKNAEDSPELSGFVRQQTGGKDFFTNDPNSFMRCEGDLFVDGVIWLKDLKIQTEEGCRIHATATVFISGPIEYVDESALTNLQIQSSRAIFMGAGVCIDCYQKIDSEYGTNWAVSRAGNTAYWGGVLRGRTDMNGYAAEIQTDFRKVSNDTGVVGRPAAGVNASAHYAQGFQNAGIVLVDPKSPYWDYSNTPYRRLLLNAPDVQSRYNGDFQGWIIAEFALWKLGSFSFKFDPVFKAVPIFPLINIDHILKVQD